MTLLSPWYPRVKSSCLPSLLFFFFFNPLGLLFPDSSPSSSSFPSSLCYTFPLPIFLSGRLPLLCWPGPKNLLQSPAVSCSVLSCTASPSLTGSPSLCLYRPLSQKHRRFFSCTLPIFLEYLLLLLLLSCCYLCPSLVSLKLK